MKFLTLLAILSLSTVFSSAYAAEADDEAGDVVEYCNEQAELAGIEDATEQQAYLRDCAASFTTTSDIPQSTD